MDIRIECVAGDPPTWKVFLGEFFWSCTSREEAETWAARAAADGYFYSRYRLPSPMTPSGPRGMDGGGGTQVRPQFGGLAAEPASVLVGLPCAVQP